MHCRQYVTVVEMFYLRVEIKSIPQDVIPKESKIGKPTGDA